jgi:hypothetical protein
LNHIEIRSLPRIDSVPEQTHPIDPFHSNSEQHARAPSFPSTFPDLSHRYEEINIVSESSQEFPSNNASLKAWEPNRWDIAQVVQTCVSLPIVACMTILDLYYYYIVFKIEN